MFLMKVIIAVCTLDVAATIQDEAAIGEEFN
jgi:hypothetical protein